MYVNCGAMSRSWFERLRQPESGGYSCSRASEVDITIGTLCTLPGSPCTPAAPSLAGALKLGQSLNSPTILLESTRELKRALGWDIRRCTRFRAFGGFGSWLNETETDERLILRDVRRLEIAAVAAHMVYKGFAERLPEAWVPFPLPVLPHA